MKSLTEIWAESNRRFEDRLAALYKNHGEPENRLFEAMNYSLNAGGKRLRPFLVYQFCAACGGREEDADNAALAVEMIHTYSLIHDDLPAMDDDDYRRGKLTNHKVYGEAMAILAGDGLLTDAFRLLASSALPPEMRAACVKLLALEAGPWGMVGGQVLDILSEERALTETELVCGSVNVGSTLAGINMDAVAMMGRIIRETAERDPIGCAKLVVFCKAVEDNPFMAGAFHGVGEPECVINVGVSGPGVVAHALKECRGEKIDVVAGDIYQRLCRNRRQPSDCGR